MRFGIKALRSGVLYLHYSRQSLGGGCDTKHYSSLHEIRFYLYIDIPENSVIHHTKMVADCINEMCGEIISPG